MLIQLQRVVLVNLLPALELGVEAAGLCACEVLLVMDVRFDLVMLEAVLVGVLLAVDAFAPDLLLVLVSAILGI